MCGPGAQGSTDGQEGAKPDALFPLLIPSDTTSFEVLGYCPGSPQVGRPLRDAVSPQQFVPETPWKPK